MAESCFEILIGVKIRQVSDGQGGAHCHFSLAFAHQTFESV